MGDVRLFRLDPDRRDTELQSVGDEAPSEAADGPPDMPA
jgi:hypothetical protein